MIILKVFLEHLNILVEPLVELIGVVQLDLDVRHLVDLLLVNLNHCLVALELSNLLLEIVQLTLESIETLFVLALHECHLSLQLRNLFILVA